MNLDSAVKHPGRDLELPMSPIEKPSTLDLDMADSSVVSSLNHSFYPPRLNTTTLPKVSTMKLPQGPVINDLQTNEKVYTVRFSSSYSYISFVVLNSILDMRAL